MQKLSMLQTLPVPARKPDQWSFSSCSSQSVKAYGWVLSYLLNAFSDAVWQRKDRLTLAGPATCHASMPVPECLLSVLYTLFCLCTCAALALALALLLWSSLDLLM